MKDPLGNFGLICPFSRIRIGPPTLFRCPAKLPQICVPQKLHNKPSNQSSSCLFWSLWRIHRLWTRSLVISHRLTYSVNIQAIPESDSIWKHNLLSAVINLIVLILQIVRMHQKVQICCHAHSQDKDDWCPRDRICLGRKVTKLHVLDNVTNPHPRIGVDLRIQTRTSAANHPGWQNIKLGVVWRRCRQ